MECQGCNNEYDQEERQPRSLPCGHTFCSSCIKANLKDSKILCFQCHTKHNAVDVVQFPLNNDIENSMSGMKMDVDATPSGVSPASTTGLAGHAQGQGSRLDKKTLDLLKKEMNDSLAKTDVEVQATMDGLDQYSLQVERMKDEHMQLIAQLQDSIAFHQQRYQEIEEEKARIRELRALCGANRRRGNRNQ